MKRYSSSLWSEVAQSYPTLCDPMDSSLHQAPPSMGFSRQQYWSGLPFPSSGDLPYPGIEPGLPHCRQTLYHLSHQRSSERKTFPKKGNAKECSNYHTIALTSNASKVMLKILQVRLQQYMNWELPGVQAGFRKGRGTRDQIANIQWIIDKAKEFQKNIYFCFIDYAKAFDYVDHNKSCGKF